MLELCVVGSSKFVLGFQLAGIRNTIEADETSLKLFRECMQNQSVGIIITDEETMEKFDEHDRLQIESSVRPVVIILSETASSDSLRKMIKKSIGVDLWQ